MKAKSSYRWDWLRRWPMAIWMTIVWVMLWGDLTVANVCTGLVVSFLLLRVFPMPKVGFDGRWSLIGAVILLAQLLWDIARASISVAVQALRWHSTPRGAVIRVQLRSESDLVLTLTGELTSLIPGSLVVEAHRLTGILYLHVLDVTKEGSLEKARRDVLEQEKRVMHALATDADIAAAGIRPRPWKRHHLNARSDS
ncbi:Na+/H+ antiporter subunit E [Ruania alba]|uniref:Multisubunit sodium/proton antiporter, MrpE subunit n=1 Tax=Ruania alba TaxID=648782 RepID=A0A1H5KPZ5_9MICO|nr:Na+/H+ antiporter subunit E [Ruania alba]SEE66939.1 multisubunit sodium/proton antiporter, MrpE subunit [Ruania alba]